MGLQATLLSACRAIIADGASTRLPVLAGLSLTGPDPIVLSPTPWGDMMSC